MNDNRYQDPYGGQYTAYGRPPKRSIGTGGIIAIVLTVSLLLLIAAGAVVVGKMLFDPDSRISLYNYLDGEEQTTAEKEGSGRHYYDNGTETEKQPESSVETVPAPAPAPEIDSGAASESMQGVIVGSDGKALSTAQIYAKAAPSVVGINVAMQNGSGSGSGVIMTSDGYILTNAHVVEGALNITVVMLDGSEYPATLIGSDSPTDIAVIHVDQTGLSQATFGDSDKVVVAEDAIAIGNPMGMELSSTITKGIISAINRNITINNYKMTLIQTDAAINPGNSGGALLNAYGEVIGITSAKMMDNYATSVEGIGFAIPINTALTIARDLAANGHVTGRAYLGITIQTQYVQVENRYEYRVIVMSVEEDSPAEKAGMEVGDAILSFNGTPISETSDLMAVRDQLAPGDTVPMVIERNGEQTEISITLTEAQ